MTRRKELPFPIVALSKRNHAGIWTDNPNIEATHIPDIEREYIYGITETEAQMFAELVRRVIDKDDFTEFAKKCYKEIFEEGE